MHTLASLPNSAFDWARSSHRRLLLAALLAVAMLAAVVTFAAEGQGSDKVKITVSKKGQNIAQDFKVNVRYTPKDKRENWNVRVSIDGHRIDNRVGKNKKGNDGKKRYVYKFKYGATEDGRLKTKKFDHNLLKPGEHVVKVAVCKNSRPDAKCKVIKRETKRITISKTSAVASFQSNGPTIVNLEAGAVTSPADTRLRFDQPDANPAEGVDVTNVDEDVTEEALTAEEDNDPEGDDAESEDGVESDDATVPEDADQEQD